MDDATRTFDRHRPRLKGIAYRMLGSVAEAEDIVQDAWLRWHEADHHTLDNAEAWLVTVTTRLALDRLRSAQRQREHYVGTWLPEPMVETDADGPATPEVGDGLARLLQVYRERPVTLIRLASTRDFKALRSFADAFRLRKEG